MDNSPLQNRRFSDAELREIIQKAVEVSSRSTSLTRQEGHSLEDLKAIGAEVGIDPARLEEAARMVVAQGGTGRRHLFGGPIHLHMDRSVPGEIEPDQYAAALALIRRELGVQGEASEIHGSLEWRMASERGERHVSITSRDGETRITAGANISQAAIVTFLPGTIMGTMGTIIGIVSAAEAGSGLGIAAAAMILPTIWTVGRQIVKTISRRQAEGLERVMTSLGRLAGESREDE